MFQFLKRPATRLTTLVLLFFMGSYYAFPKNEKIPLGRPLKEVPQEIQGWQMIQESEIETEVQDLLRADDTLNRVYARSNTEVASLFVAFFKTQTTGVAPHSPKVCLPGSGWTPSQSGIVEIALPGQQDPIRVNRYIVSRGDSKSVVLYWYQSPWRVIASEYSAKVYTVLDSFLHHRSDTSLVRVIAPVNTTTEKADETAIEFVRTSFGVLREYLPR
jgi:EpsI family protein